MAYLISQMWLCLLITAIIAGIIGWLLRGSGKKKLQALERQWQEEYNVVDGARVKYKNQVKRLSSIESRNKELELQVSQQKDAFEETIQKLKEQVDIKETKQSAFLVEKEEEYTANLQKLDTQLSAIEKDKLETKTYFEKIIQTEQEKSSALATELHISKADLASAEEKIALMSQALDKEKKQKVEIAENFTKKETELKEQLNQHQDLLNKAVEDKKAVDKNLAKTLLDAKQSASNNSSSDNESTIKSDTSDIGDKIKTGFDKAKDEVSHKTSDAKESIKSGFDKAKDEILHKTSDAKESLKSGFDKAKDEISHKTSDVKESIKSGFDKAKDEVSHKASDAKESIKSGFDKAKDEVSHKASDAKESIKSGFDKAKDEVSHKTSDAKESIKSGLDKAKDEASNTKESLKSGFDSAKDSISSTQDRTPTSSNHQKKDNDSSENSFFSRIKDKFDDFNNAKSSPDANAPESKHETKISADIKSMLAATGITALAKTGVDKARSGFEQAKDTLIDHADSDTLAISSIQSVSTGDAKRLVAMKIETTKDLLSRTNSDTAISLLAKSLGKDKNVIRQWTNNADLIRVKGVDALLAELIELSGIESVEALAKSDSNQVAEGIAVVYQTISKRSELPDANELQNLISEAKAICRS